MRKITFLVCILALWLHGFSQGTAPLSEGEKQLNFGTGLSGYGIPAYVGLDFAVHNEWTVGPVVKIHIDDDIRFGALGRVDYHWNRLLEIPSEFDFYLGANVGLISGDDLEFDLGLQLGGRWYWSEKWGLNVELGGGNGYGTTVGLSMKL